jgi:hypothetical protein
VYVLALCLNWRHACVSTSASEKIICPTDTPVDLEARVQQIELREKSPRPQPHMMEVADTHMNLDNYSPFLPALSAIARLHISVTNFRSCCRIASLDLIDTISNAYRPRLLNMADFLHLPPRTVHNMPVLSPRGKFDPLSINVAIELCTAWFERYHPWFPILHQPSSLASLQDLASSNTPRPFLRVISWLQARLQKCIPSCRALWI